MPAKKIFGRKLELQQIETALKTKTHCFTISGNNGNGKTSLAIEVGKKFAEQDFKVCLVDYSAFVGVETVELAIKEMVISLELEDDENLEETLNNTPILLILDQLSNLDSEPLQELLAKIKQWSQLEQCRIIITSQINYDEYLAETNNHHLELSNLAAKPALEYCLHLLNLSKQQLNSAENKDLHTILQLVDYNPLLIKILVPVLQYYSPEQLAKYLLTLINTSPSHKLWIVLNLSLELYQESTKNNLINRLAKLLGLKISEQQRLKLNILRLVPYLGVFQGGAFEPEIISILDISAKQWQLLCSALTKMGLIESEHVQDFRIPYLKFHPSLRNELWSNLPIELQVGISSAYRWRYVQLISYLFFEEGKNTEMIELLAKQDLPNILNTVYTAIYAKEKWNKKVANYVDLFLKRFGMYKESVAMNQRLNDDL